MSAKASGSRRSPAARGDAAGAEIWRSVPRGAHEWISFPDPDYERTWLFDVTFLMSRWTCIYGRGCKGVLTGPTPELEQGCCSYGAHLTDAKDARRVEAAAATLTPEQWQFHARARSGNSRKPQVVRRNRSGELTTRLTKDACIFLNRPGFPGGPGCALHRAALERGRQPLELKPDVCWQLPLRRDEQVDEGGHVTAVIRQWDRRDWGKGGTEFHWWCTESPDAFVGERPVYEEMEHELIAMVGRKIYSRLVSYLRARSGDGRHDARGSEASDGGRAAPARASRTAATASLVPVALPHPAVRRRRT